MEDILLITELNDFTFCPVSIYYSKNYHTKLEQTFKKTPQFMGKAVHASIDNKTYTTSKNILQGKSVYSAKYNLIGKIDQFDIKKGILIEKKKKIKNIYDGYIFQLYAEYYSLIEEGYDVKKLKLYSIDDNKTYDILLPKEDEKMNNKFLELLDNIKKFDINKYKNHNKEKCNNCIYRELCVINYDE